MSEELPVLRPDSTRAARTVARCHARLEAQRRKRETAARTPDARLVVAERFALVGTCAAYLLAMAGNLLKTFEIR